MDEKLKRENMQKRAVFYVYVIFWEKSGQADVENGWPHIYSDILQNAPFRSQIFRIFFASGGKGALTPLTKIMRTFLSRSCIQEENEPHAITQPEGPRAEVGFPTADQGFPSIQSTLCGFCGI